MPVAGEDDSRERVAVAVRETPLRRIEELRSGELAVVRGEVARRTGASLDSPLTGERCLMWSLRVTRAREAPHITVLEQQCGVELFVNDGTGEARVDGRDALFLTDRGVSTYAGTASPDLRARVSGAGLGDESLVSIEVAELRAFS